MKVLFVGGLYPEGSESYYENKMKRPCLATPSNVYQWGVIEGLLANGVELEVSSFPFLPTYPHIYRELFTREEDILFEGRIIGAAEAYCTIPGIKELWIIGSLKRKIREWGRKLRNDENGLILIYSMYGPFLKAAVEVSRENPMLCVCPIATDLFVSSLGTLKGASFLKKIQGFFEYRMIKKGLEFSDTFVLLAKGMEHFIPRAIGNSVIVEGIASDEYPRPTPKKDLQGKTLLYTGSLGPHTSVKELLEAFSLTSNPDFRLVICGMGCYEKEVLGKARLDKRIVYKGSVSRSEAVRLQKEATVLINPRLPSIPDTPYSFPSKTIEYLASGTPMIGYRLVGITSDYYNHMFIPRDESIRALSEIITETLSLPQEELDRKALEAWEFIMEHKTAEKQMNRFLQYIRQKKHA